MNRRDPNPGNRQAGGYRSEDNGWDSPRQANQWQGDPNRQSGGGHDWDADTNERGDTFNREHLLESRYAGDSHNDAGSGRSGGDERWGGGDDRGYRGRGQGGGYGARGGSVERGYRFSGSGSRAEGAHTFDASGGNDYGTFTSEDFGGRDFSRTGSGGVTGGMHPSNSYRPSFGPGSWGSHRDDYARDRGGSDHDSWREYGERRGFLQRAGDEVASWFGDDDAARRREADHRGRGPSDYTRSDERIREDINDALTHDWRVDASNVRVAVKNGEVTLEGTVDSRQDKRRAEDLADDVSGVRHVQNNLRLNSTSAQSRSTYASGAGTMGSAASSSTSSSPTGASTAAKPGQTP